MMTLGRSHGPGPRQLVVGLPRALWRVGFQRRASAVCIKMLISQVFDDFAIFVNYSRF